MRWNEIFTESQPLNELFDKVAAWQWTDKDQVSRDAKFNVAGTEYRMSITLMHEPSVWSAEFVNQSVHSSRWGNTRTMDNDAVQVFGTVISILKEFMQEVQPDGVVFSGYVDEKRDELYKRMIHHQMDGIKAMGYNVTEVPKGSHTEFKITKTA